MAAPFSRSDLVELFTDLGERLGRNGVRANVYIVGGAAMALLYDDRRVTRDIDSVILDGHGALTDAVREIARERGLPSSWLNEQASAYVSMQPDVRQTRVFDHPNLGVAAASPRHLLAMKLVAARPTDVDDIRILLKVLGVHSVAEAEAVLAEVFPDAVLKRQAHLVLEDILAADPTS